MHQTFKIKNILDKVKAYIEVQHFPKPGTAIQAAVSGGCDSMVMLEILLQLGYQIDVLHVNYGLRGAESERDAQFVQAEAAKKKLAFRLLEARLSGAEGNIQQAAREIRYDWFRRISTKPTATAHHQLDQAETLLMRFMKGSGLEGLGGIKPSNNRVFRPILCLSKSEIMAFAKDMGLPFVEDSSNSKLVYDRNIVRREILPVISKHFPGAVTQMAGSADHLLSASDLLDELLERSEHKYLSNCANGVESWDLEEILKLKAGIPALYHYLKKYGLNYATAQRIALSLNQSAGKMFKTAHHEMLTYNGKLLVREIRKIHLEPIQIDQLENNRQYTFGSYHLEFSDGVVKPEIQSGILCDYDKIKFPVTIRNRQSGDRFKPLGMTKGNKLLSDWMTDRKMNRWDKNETPLVVDASGEIVLICPEGISEKVKLESTTRHILSLKAYQN